MLENALEVKKSLLKIYKRVLHENNPLEIKRYYLDYLRLQMMLGTNNPIFEVDKYSYGRGNCYNYALMMPLPALFWLNYEIKSGKVFNNNIGFTLSDVTLRGNRQLLIDYFIQDCENLGIKVFDSSLTQDNRHNGYKVAIYNGLYNFHFMRQNSDGSWSNKLGYNRPIERVVPEAIYNDLKEELVLQKVVEVVKPVIREKKR